MTYATQTAARQNAPAYYATIEGLTGKKFATHPIRSATGTVIVCLDTPEGNAQRLEPLTNRASVGELRLNLTDVNRELTNAVSTEKTSPALATLINRNVTIYGGYRDEPESEYTALFSGELREIRMIAPLIYQITVADKKRRLDDELMSSLSDVVTTEPAESTPQGNTTMKLRSTQGIYYSGQVVQGVPRSGKYLLYRQDGTQYEKVTVVSVDANQQRVAFAAPLENPWLPTQDAFTSAPFIRGNIVNVWYSLLTGSFSTLGTSSFPLIDFYNSPTGIAIPASDIDTTSVTDTRDKFLSNFDVDFLFTGPISARQFFEDEIYSLGFWPVVSGAGKISIRTFLPPGPITSTLPKIYKEHMAEFPEWERRIQDHINKVIVKMDLNPYTGAFFPPSQRNFADPTDQTTTKETVLYEISSSGLRSGLDGASLADEMASRILTRFRIPPVRVRVPLIFTKRGLQLGDMVQVSHDALPDNELGTLGLTDKIFEVIELQPDYRRGTIEATLLWTGFKKYAFIGPASMADYGSATATEKLYAYWGDTNNKVAGGTVDGYYTG